MDLTQKYQQAANWIKNADNVIVLTGAGMSVDSGLPDYRGEGGQWGQVEAQNGKSVFEVMNPENIDQNPKEMWLHFANCMHKHSLVVPHKGYHLLLEMLSAKNYFVLTSNVDAQFFRTHFNENNIYEMHGSNQYLQCTKPCSDEVFANQLDLPRLAGAVENGFLPTCEKCGSLLRPNVYMFRDKTYVPTRTNQQKERYSEFLKNLKNNTLAIEIGSGPHVQSIRRRTRELGSKYGAQIIRINPKDFEVKAPHLSVPSGALTSITQIYNLLHA